MLLNFKTQDAGNRPIQSKERNVVPYFPRIFDYLFRKSKKQGNLFFHLSGGADLQPLPY